MNCSCEIKSIIKCMAIFISMIIIITLIVTIIIINDENQQKEILTANVKSVGILTLAKDLL